MKTPTMSLAALASLGLAATSTQAAMIITPGHIVSGPTTGTLIVIDVPFVSNGSTGGPNWTEDADDGFTTVNDPIQDYRINDKLWEPDGTPASEAGSYFTYPNGPNPSVQWDFGAGSGIIIPDGSTINAIYAVWFARGSDGITYRYTEGAASDSYSDPQNPASTGDLVLSWTDDVNTVRNANFQRIFSTPIVVEGGDGFVLTGTDDIGNAAHIDAVIIDVTFVPEPSTTALLGLGGLALMLRRRK